MSSRDDLARTYGLDLQTTYPAFKDRWEICLEGKGPGDRPFRALHCFRLPDPGLLGRTLRGLAAVQQAEADARAAGRDPDPEAAFTLLEALYAEAITDLLGYANAEGQPVTPATPSWKVAAPRHHRIAAAAGVLRRWMEEMPSEKKLPAASESCWPGNGGRDVPA